MSDVNDKNGGVNTMNWLANAKMVYKLSALIFIALVALCGVGYTGYYYLGQADKALNIMYDDRLIPVKLLNESRSHARGINGAVLEMMLTTDVKKNQELKDYIDDRIKKNNANLAEIEKVNLDPKAKELVVKVKMAQQDNRAARNQVVELAMQNKNTEAYALYTTKLSLLTTIYTDNLRDLADYLTKLSEQANAENDVKFEQATKVLIGSILVAFLILGLVGLVITRMITIPIQFMVISCEELAAGDFRDKPRKMFRKDEIGQLADILVNMRGSIREVLKQVNESAELVAASSEELTASAEQSAQATTQVAVTISEVAQGAEEQAKAVNDTSAIVEQMSAGIQNVAANANEVSSVADKATSAANQGGRQ